MKTIALDLGDVAIEYDMNHMFSVLAKELGTSPQKLREWWDVPRENQPSFHIRSDAGLSRSAIHRELIKRWGYMSMQDMEAIFCQEACIEINPEFLEFRDRLAAHGCELIILSNMNIIHKKFIIETLPEIFEPYIAPERRFFSCDLGVIKNACPKNFEHIGKKIGYDVKNVILIDDRPENIQGIAAAGGMGIVFNGDFEAILSRMYQCI